MHLQGEEGGGKREEGVGPAWLVGLPWTGRRARRLRLIQAMWFRRGLRYINGSAVLLFLKGPLRF